MDTPPPPFAWQSEHIRLLGRLSDAEVAHRLQLPVAAVQLKRIALGRDSFLPGNHWRQTPTPYQLFFGPYQPPAVRKGQKIRCALQGQVEVGDLSGGFIPWPVRRGTPSLILCGDLIRAVRREAAIAVAYHWGVCPGTVSKWRHHLGVEPLNAGTVRLNAILHAKVWTPEMRAHLSRLKTGKPRTLSKEGAARLLATLRRPKSAQWHRHMAKHFAARRGKPVDPNDRVWTAAEEKLLGKMPDADLARRIGRSTVAVQARRHVKGIPNPAPIYQPWTKPQLAMLRRLPDAVIAQRTGHSLKSVGGKRQELGLLVRPHPPAWTPAEDRLLGTKPDTQIAAQLGRSRAQVRLRRIAMGRAPVVKAATRFAWTPDQDHLLGTASDGAIARQLGRTRFSVQLRRLKLGLPSYCKRNWRR